MYKKRRSNSSLRQAPTNPPAPSTPSAATAAAQAFLKKTQDESQLSNAAAAAALRSQSSTPAPVADLQTKRMVRRGSVSSIGSVGSASRQPFSSQSQQRRGSNGSMTSRSFRSPSPGAPIGAPPVPSLPGTVPPIPSKSAMRTSRTSSIDSNTRSTAPAYQNGLHGGLASSSWASADKRQSAMPALNTSVDRANAASPTAGSPRNINFSRPMSPSVGSPTGSPAAGSVKARPASSLGLTQEQYNRLRQQGNMEQLRAVAGSPNSAGKVTMVFDPASRKMVPAIIQHELMGQEAGSPSPARGQQSGMVYDAASRKMVPAGTSVDAIPARDFTHTASGQPARAMSLTSAHIAAAKRMTSPHARVASPEAVALAQGKQIASPPAQAARVSSPPPVVSRPTQPVARASSMGAVPAPSAEQIKAFQSRAASLLARPQTQLPTAPPKQAPRPTSMLMRDPSSEAVKPAAGDVAAIRQGPTTPTTAGTGAAKGRTVSLSSSTAGPESPLQRLSRDGKSASPARSARFLESPLLEAAKHKPPPRSTSPGKSAMKGHSPRTMSPVGTHNRDSVALSDAGSAVSDESHSTSKKKKSVRVSFEERPILVGNAAAGGSPTDTVLSPQYKKALREAGEQELNSMGDRPALPSFGSVRGRKTADDIPNEPESPTRLVKPSAGTLDKAAEEPAPSSLVAAPEIAVQPATPRTEDVDKLNDSAPAQTEESTPAEGSTDATASHPDYAADIGDHPWATTHPADDNESDTDDDLNAFSDAPETPEERAAGFRSLDAILESPSTEEQNPLGGAAVAPTTEPVEEHTVEEEAAPVPIVATADTAVPLAAEVDPITLDPALVHAITDTQEIQPPVGEDWDTVKAYWSSLSEQKKREIEMQANGETGALVTEEPVPTTKPIKSALKKPANAQDDDQRLPPWPDTQYQQTAKPKASGAARPKGPEREPSDPTHLRNSMRTGGTMRTSMHEAPIHKSSRDGQTQKPSKPDAMTNASPEAIALARQFMPRREPKRRGSNDSDASDSSFKKRRGRNPEPRTQQYNIKRSMRDAAPSMRATEMSPTGSAAGRKPLRSSVRAGSIDSTTSEPKGGFLGLGKSKHKPSKSKSKASSGPSFRSRFADSSDEDEEGGFATRLGGFRSRFANSDDDDSDYEPPMPAPRIPSAPSLTSRIKAPAAAPKKEPAPKLASAPQLAPVRGIPRRATDAESTDLSDSDDDVKAPRANVPAPAAAANRPGTPPASTALDFGSGKKATANAPTSPQTPTSPHANGTASEGHALDAGTLRTGADAPEKRRGLFSRAGGGKKKSALAESKWASTDAPPSPASPASATRPETPSRMAKTLRDGARSPSRSSFLRRLSLTGPHPAQAFPYPPPPIPEEYAAAGAAGGRDRPNTSDGVSSAGGGVRPPLGERMESSQTAPTSGADEAGRRGGKLRKGEPVISERTGRKKKFQGLRRAFGLMD